MSEWLFNMHCVNMQEDIGHIQHWYFMLPLSEANFPGAASCIHAIFSCIFSFHLNCNFISSMDISSLNEWLLIYLFKGIRMYGTLVSEVTVISNQFFSSVFYRLNHFCLVCITVILILDYIRLNMWLKLIKPKKYSTGVVNITYSFPNECHNVGDQTGKIARSYHMPAKEYTC